MGSRVAKRNCLICGLPVSYGNAVWCTGADINGGQHSAYEAEHMKNGTAAVRLANRNPKGLIHIECLTPHLMKTKETAAKRLAKEEQKKPKAPDARILKDGPREWDE